MDLYSIINFFRLGMLILQKISKDDYQRFRANGNTNHLGHDPAIFFNEYFPRNFPLSGHHFCLIWLSTGKAERQLIGSISYSHKSNVVISRSKLREITIKEEFQNKGYGLRIMKIIEEEAQEYGSSFVSLFVFGHNLAAQSLYTKFGFSIWKEFNQGFSMIKFLKALPKYLSLSQQ